MWLLKNSIGLLGLWLVFMFSCTSAVAQHEPLLSQYMLNSLPLNPAFSGSRESLSCAASYRNQWTGFDGAPTTSTFSAHSPMKNESFAVGMVVFRDELGVSRTSGFQFIGAYRMKLGTGKLSFGLSGGMKQIKNNWSEVITTEEADIAFNSGDQVNWNPDFGAGMYYFNNKYYISVSVPTLIKATYVNGDGYTANFKPRASNFYFNSGLNLTINKSWQFKPSMMLRYHTVNAMTLDVNALANWTDQLEFGVSYRTSKAMIGMIRYFIQPQTSIAYGFDHQLGELGQYARGTHELTLRYDLVFRTNATSPKFF